MSYQSCRWYDPYPRLAFALKLLELMPLEARNAAWQRVLDNLEGTFQKPWGVPPHRNAMIWGREMAAAEMAFFRADSREYSRENEGDSPLGLKALLLLKNSPDTVKSRVTEDLLSYLGNVPTV